jgi:hypothetical protein
VPELANFHDIAGPCQHEPDETIITPGDSEAVSFNDDTAPDTRLTDNQRLSFDAQVMPGNSLDWYYQMLQLFEPISRGLPLEELKSKAVWERFETLTPQRKERIWQGLSKVRIHITDPRPYRQSFNNIASKMLRTDDPATYLQRQVAAKNPEAIWLSMRANIYTAQRILDDSVASRVRKVSRFLSDGPFSIGSDPTTDEGDDDPFDLRKVSKEIKPLVRKATILSAKSAAAFHEALSCMTEFDPEDAVYNQDLIRKRMMSRVLDTHAFDKGDASYVPLIEDARRRIVGNLKPPSMDPDTHTNMPIRPYSELESEKSFFVQAADIAGGFASRLMERSGLTSVAGSFEYVTYNGSRLSRTEAEEQERLLRARVGS